MRRQGGLPAILLVLVAMGGFGFVVWRNAQPVPALRTIIPTEQQPTADAGGWQAILRAGFGSNSTPLPTIPPIGTPFVPPTLPPAGDTNLIPIPPADVSADLRPTINAIVTPTRPGPTPSPAGTEELAITAQSVTRPPSVWQPPPLIPPISRDPLGRDHYWFIRPVDSNATNFALFSYPYGSRGPLKDNPYRIHNGIDMPNPVGQTVRAAGSGTVVWAGGGFQNTFSYGNAVFIEHDFGYRGQPLNTLYAHLSAVLVTPGQVVNAGDPIGLVGNTGRVSGPHVHFEVRLGGQRYGDTYNPLLWMVPYVGTGVIAGRVVDARGNLLDDELVTVRDWRTGLVTDSTTTYIYDDTPTDVNADPLWQENFVVADVPVGRYEVIANVDGQRVSKIIDVVEGTTSFVELSPVQPATPQPANP
ncbi:MAG: peptidoglycan DD-metalloendopeptidase family protein [Chloroflexi bacterium]|nr:peptidoglycan DD-metalloendopeptidase family protein [Chloroflexota bacterium]